MITVSQFLESVDQIAGEKPTYKLGADGTGGKCDCIGLIIGAIRRAGGKWTGTHGSNYAARNEMNTLAQIVGTGDLSVGEVVYKAKSPGDSGYSLPSRYDKSGDRRDYYHVGVVRSVYPLKIVHCTGPGIVEDTRLGKWSYHGMLSRVDYGTGEKQPAETPKEEEGADEPMTNATVTADRGSTVNLRKTPAGSLLVKVPVGTEVEIEETSGSWSKVSYAGKTGWMQSTYLARNQSYKDVLNRLDAIEKRLDALERGVG